MKFRILSLLSILSIWSIVASSQQVIPLYDSKPPGSEDWTWSEAIDDDNIWDTKLVYNVAEPTMTAYLPPYYLATGASVIIAPGGGFHVLSIDSEGIDVAKWLNSRGVAAFVLKYRVAHTASDDPVTELMQKTDAKADMIDASPLAMADGLAAVRYVREHAEEFDIDPSKIGFMGFSAGGTVALNVAYNSDESSRPNFLAPIYASNNALINPNVPEAEMPMFVAVAADDGLQLMPHSIQIFEDWIASDQPVELHVYQKGGHGFGMRKKNLPSDQWYERFGDWLHMHGYLQKLYPNKYEKLYGQDAVEKGKMDLMVQLSTNYAQLDRYESAIAIEDPKVVFLGNSITEGWGYQDSAFFADHNFLGRGISGQTSSQLLLRFRQDVIDHNPEAVVIHIGTNDIAENTGPYNEDYTMSNIISMVELAQANDIEVILAAVLPATKFEWRRALGDRSDMIVALNNRIRTYAQDHQLTYVDYHTALKNDANGMDPDIAEDGVHPSAKGYTIMKELILEAIDSTLNH